MKGRGNSHAITTMEAVRLEINNLIKSKSLQKGKVKNFNLRWTTGAEINIISVYDETEIYLQLKYNITDKTTKVSKTFDYRIYIERVKSNLGKGHNLYFICPQSGIRCKILYLCYGAEKFKCRKAYNNRIYYNSQTHSKEYRLNGRYFKLERTVNELYEKRKTTTYKGKATKRHLRMCKLLEKKANVDDMRSKQFEQWFYRYFRH